MKRRLFLKSCSFIGASFVSSMAGIGNMIPNVKATNISSREVNEARAALIAGINYVRPAVLPQVINVFLHGGPSQFAGNLTNIEDINANSQNPYPSDLFPGGSQHTINGFWSDAGGDAMERMLLKNRLSIYRTVNRAANPSYSHRTSVFENLTGKAGIEEPRAGVVANLAEILSANSVINDSSIFPFVSFDGDSTIFNRGSDLKLSLPTISLDRYLINPYRTAFGSVGDSRDKLDNLVKAMTATENSQYQKIIDLFGRNNEFGDFVGNLKDRIDNYEPPSNPDFVVDSNEIDEQNEVITYPSTGYGPLLEVALNIVINNSDTLFVSIGSLGGLNWDDHSFALYTNRYSARMDNLMTSLEVAAQHLEATGKGNVVINVYGDFGRSVNLNHSMGWDHGNCQNLYTVSANPNVEGVIGAIDDRIMGKVVGQTIRVGEKNANQQFMVPSSNSYQCEPFAIAASVYKYFGIQNPEILTGGNSAINEKNTINRLM